MAYFQPFFAFCHTRGERIFTIIEGHNGMPFPSRPLAPDRHFRLVVRPLLLSQALLHKLDVDEDANEITWHFASEPCNERKPLSGLTWQLYERPVTEEVYLHVVPRLGSMMPLEGERKVDGRRKRKVGGEEERGGDEVEELQRGISEVKENLMKLKAGEVNEEEDAKSESERSDVEGDVEGEAESEDEIEDEAKPDRFPTGGPALKASAAEHSKAGSTAWHAALDKGKNEVRAFAAARRALTGARRKAGRLEELEAGVARAAAQGRGEVEIEEENSGDE